MVQFITQIIDSISTFHIILTVAFITYTIFIYYGLLKRRYIVDQQLFDKIITYEEKESTKLEEAVDKKKDGFLNIPTISLHYANEEEINNIYNDYFKEPIIEQIVSEKARELGGGVKGEVSKILGASIDGKDISKSIQTMKIHDISIAEKFRRYQRETIKNNQVTMGLDLVDIDLTDLNNFNKLVDEFESKFDMKLDDMQVESTRAMLKEKAADKIIARLENATGWILLEGKFKITSLPNGFYECICEHPVNEYFTEEGNKVTFSMLLGKNYLRPNVAGNYEQSIGKFIPLKVYGKVWRPLDRQADIWELQITPLVVY